MLYLVFDGECGFCTAAAYWIRTLDRKRQLRLVPCQNEALVRSLGLDPAACREAAWAVTEEGRTFCGAGAVWAALAWSLGHPGLVRLYFLPVFRPVADWAYRWIATHRHLFPGRTPHCVSHPEECVSRTKPA